MIITRSFLSFLFFLIGSNAHAQQLSQISFLDGANLSFFSFRTSQDVLIRVSADGKILEWGTEILSDRANYFAPALQPYMGRIEYYGQESDAAFNLQLKSIGITSITYYASNEEVHKRGKLKSLGTLQFDYYSTYDEKSLQGKIKMAGSLLLDYYRQYEQEVFRGKLKSVGSMAITYYSSFDDKYNTGKLKAVGTQPYIWYSPNNHPYMRGGLKSNNYRQVIAGVTYVLR